jgi:hypothetical protein
MTEYLKRLENMHTQSRASKWQSDFEAHIRAKR